MEEITKSVMLWFNEAGLPKRYEQVEKVYTEESLLVIHYIDGGRHIYDKYPLEKVWMVREIEN